jgi:hypothetical protein
MQMMRIRIKATGQVTEMVPAVARAMILGGTAEEVKLRSVENMSLAAAGERAVAPAQSSSPKKSRFARS